MATIWALTGGIGSGKSTVLQMFAELGAHTISADAIVHSLYEQDEVILCIGEMFPGSVTDGRIDKSALAKIIFTDPLAKQQLEAYIHPLVRDEIAAMAQDLTICEVPLYFEMAPDLQKRYQGVICVQASVEQATSQATNRGHGNSFLAERQAAQVQERHGDYNISNDGTLEDLKEKVHDVWGKLKSA